MRYVITSTVTVCQAVEANSASEAISKTLDDFRNFYLEGDAPGKGIVIGGSSEPSTVDIIEDGRIKRIGHAAGEEFVPLKESWSD